MKKVIVANARKERQEKRNLKEKKGAVNEKHIKDHDFFVDKALCDPVVDNKNDEHINRKHKLDQCEIEGFTVLGVANFSKKAKVGYYKEKHEIYTY